MRDKQLSDFYPDSSPFVADNKVWRLPLLDNFRIQRSASQELLEKKAFMLLLTIARMHTHDAQRSMIFRKTKYHGGSVYARRKELAKTRQSECRAEELSVLVCFSKVKRLI